MIHELNASPTTVHWGYYDGRLAPALKIGSGDSVRVETVSLPMAMGDPSNLVNFGVNKAEIPGQLTTIFREVSERGPGPHILTGPIFVEGARPGNVLQVDIVEVKPMCSFGINSFIPGWGSLPREYPYTGLKVIKFNLKTMEAEFAKGVTIPLRPFFGHLGVAPAPYYGRISSIPPGFHGGNLDNKELTNGSRIFLPIQTEGAMFSVGDGHAAQGDGEVDITAIETCMSGTLRLTVRTDMDLKWPLGETPTHIISMGIHADLNIAAEMALKNIIDYLVATKGLTRDEAYMLASVAVDFHITQMVNSVKGVHGLLPKAIFR